MTNEKMGSPESRPAIRGRRRRSLQGSRSRRTRVGRLLGRGTGGWPEGRCGKSRKRKFRSQVFMFWIFDEADEWVEGRGAERKWPAPSNVTQTQGGVWVVAFFGVPLGGLKGSAEGGAGEAAAVEEAEGAAVGVGTQVVGIAGGTLEDGVE